MRPTPSPAVTDESSTVTVRVENITSAITAIAIIAAGAVDPVPNAPTTTATALAKSSMFT